MNIILSDADKQVVSLCRDAIKSYDLGEPLWHYMGEDEFVDAIRVLIRIMDAEGGAAR